MSARPLPDHLVPDELLRELQTRRDRLQKKIEAAQAGLAEVEAALSLLSKGRANVPAPERETIAQVAKSVLTDHDGPMGTSELARAIASRMGRTDADRLRNGLSTLLRRANGSFESPRRGQWMLKVRTGDDDVAGPDEDGGRAPARAGGRPSLDD